MISRPGFRLSARTARAVAFTAAVALSLLPLPAEEALPVVGLEECVTAALEGGYDARIAANDLASARAQLAGALAKNALGLSGSAGGNRAVSTADATKFVRSGTEFVPVDYLKTATRDSAQAGMNLSGPLGTSVGLSANHNIAEEEQTQTTRIGMNAGLTLWDGYRGGRALGSARQAEFAYEVKLSGSEDGRRGIAMAAKQAYYALLAQQRQMDILRRTLDKRSEELQRNQALFDADRASRIDLQQAKINRSQAELDLRKAADSLATAREKLSGLAGWSPDREYRVAELPDAALPETAPAAAVARALERRTELRQLDLNLASGAIALSLAKSQYSPEVSLNGSVSWADYWTTGKTSLDWSAGLSVNVPLIDSGTLGAQARQAAAQAEGYRIQREKLVADISAEVRNAARALRDLRDRVPLARSSLDLARDQYELAAARFENGSGTNLDLLEASVALSSAEAALAKGRSDAQLGLLALLDAMGE